MPSRRSGLDTKLALKCDVDIEHGWDLGAIFQALCTIFLVMRVFAQGLGALHAVCNNAGEVVPRSVAVLMFLNISCVSRSRAVSCLSEKVTSIESDLCITRVRLNELQQPTKRLSMVILKPYR